MAAVLLTLVISFAVGAVLWLVVGNRMELHPDPKQNEIRNLVVYMLVALPLVFVAVFYLFERL